MISTINSKINLIEEIDEITFGGYVYTREEINKFARRYVDTLIDESKEQSSKNTKLSKKDIGRFFGLINDFGKLNYWIKHKEYHHPEAFESKKAFQTYYNKFIGVPTDYNYSTVLGKPSHDRN